MQEVFEKIIERSRKEKLKVMLPDGFRDECITLRTLKTIVNRTAEEYSNVTTCYLQSPCEYQNKDVILPCCEWMQDNSEYDVYDTKCGNTHMFIDGSPRENEYKFCPYCGKEIKVVD